MKKKLLVLWIFAIVLFAGLCRAENETSNITSGSDVSLNITIQQNETQNIAQTPAMQNTSENLTQPAENITTPEQPEQVINFSIIRVFPLILKPDTEYQLNIEIKNTGNTALQNLGAFVTGNGIYTSNVEQIDLLQPDEKNYILVSLTAKNPGNISLKIKILDKTFNLNLTVSEDLAKQKEQEQTQKLTDLKARYDETSKIYSELEKQYNGKKDQGYTLKTTLDKAKEYLRNSQAAFVRKDTVDMEANLALADSELSDIKNDTQTATKPKKTFVDWIKNNIAWISSSLAALIALITILSIANKKKQAVVEKIKSIKKPRVTITETTTEKVTEIKETEEEKKEEKQPDEKA